MKNTQKKQQNNKVQEAILRALATVVDAQSGRNIVEAGMVADIHISAQNEAIVTLSVDPKRGPEMEPLRQEAENAVRAVKSVKKCTVVLTAEATEDAASSPPTRTAAPDPHGMSKNPKLSLPVRHIIAVASGKGGVGKSTVSANIALSLSKNGQKTGLLDADIYGPSQPRMFGVQGQKPDGDQNRIEPIDVMGLKLMSIGFLVDEEKSLVWRGPMVQSALYQMLRDVNWGTQDDPLDILVVDMPPGTGDAQLTMAQKVPLSGAVIVSTPQDIALLDARKGIDMFNKVDVPVLGVIENMSTHICSNCGHEEHIFGHKGAQEEAQKMGVPFLGALPLHIDVRTCADSGEPIVQAQKDGDITSVFDDIAQKIIDSLAQEA